MRERVARTRGEEAGDDGFSLKGCWSEWDADVVVTTRREVADIPLSFIKEGFHSTFAPLVPPFTLSLLCLVAAPQLMFFPTLFSFYPSLSLYRHRRALANNAIIISLSLFPLLFYLLSLSLSFSLFLSFSFCLSFCLGSSLYSPQTILCGILSVLPCVAGFFSWSLTRSKPCDECLISVFSWFARNWWIIRTVGVSSWIEVWKILDLATNGIFLCDD